MALRVAHGLFRLWLVLSVLWIGGVGITTWRTFVYPEIVVCEEVEAPAKGSCLPRSIILELQPEWDKDQRAAFHFALALALVPTGSHLGARIGIDLFDKRISATMRRTAHAR
jgi:hypothetical protein